MQKLKLIVLTEFIGVIVVSISHLIAYLTNRVFPLMMYGWIALIVIVAWLLVILIIAPVADWFMSLGE